MFYDLLIIGNDVTARRVALGTVSDHFTVGLVECSWQWEDEFWLQKSQHLAIDPDLSPESFRNRLIQGVTDLRQTGVEQLSEAGVDVWRGKPRFLDSHTVMVNRPNEPIVLSANHFLIASGTRPQFPRVFLPHRPFAMTPGELFESPRRLQSLVMLAHSRVEQEQAAVLARWGIPLKLCPMTREVAASFRPPEPPSDPGTGSLAIQPHRELSSLIVDSDQEEVVVTFRSQSEEGELKKTGLMAERVCVAGVRYGCTNYLNLSSAGIRPDEHRRIWCHPSMKTWTPHIFASGEVVGFPPDLSGFTQTERIISRLLESQTHPTETGAKEHTLAAS